MSVIDQGSDQALGLSAARNLAFVARPRERASALPASDGFAAQAFGPLWPYCSDTAVTDVFVNGESGLFIDRGQGLEQQLSWSASEREVRDLASALIAHGGRHLDDAFPCADVRLDSGARVHAVLAPPSSSGTLISIRLPRAGQESLLSLQERGMITPEQLAWLKKLVRERANLLITGGTGVGKTTLLAGLLGEVGHDERIISIEDVAELRPVHPHHVQLQARQANVEGQGAIGLPQLVRESLRMRPDRLVLGECRGEEIRELLLALNTGHDGSAGTLHASSVGDVAARLEALGALAGMDPQALARQVVSAITYVIHLDRDSNGNRFLAQVGRCELVSERLVVSQVQPW